ncbi:MAG: Gfo/Idh/MocA family oxidoreductase [Magnetospirillum sp. WYHS-4]
MVERLLIVGLGSIGRRHLACLQRLAPDIAVTVLRRPGGTAEAGVATVHNMSEALATCPQAAIVSNPAPFHVEAALALARAGVHLLVEKPLSDRLDGVAELIEECRKRRLVLQVGYCLRFDPSLAALKQALAAGTIGRLQHLKAEVGQYLPDWRPDTDYRQGVSARADLGGGALLELSHEIDTLCWLAGPAAGVIARLTAVGDLEIDVEDSADLLLDFPGNVSGTLHMDMLQRTPVRTCKAVGTAGTLLWDGMTRETRTYRVRDGKGAWEVLYSGKDSSPDTRYLEQLKHFLACIGSGGRPLVSGEDGLRVLEIVMAARRSAKEGTKVSP